MLLLKTRFTSLIKEVAGWGKWANTDDRKLQLQQSGYACSIKQIKRQIYTSTLEVAFECCQLFSR